MCRVHVALQVAPTQHMESSAIVQVLGPRGLMPNAKLGTIVTDVVPAIRGMKEGRVEFRCAPAVAAVQLAKHAPCWLLAASQAG